MVFSALAQQRWDEVMAMGADLVCFDLEDGTAMDRKDEARAQCLAQFESKLAAGTTEPRSAKALLRINSPRTLHGIKDLAAVAQMRHPPHGLVLPKIECATDVTLVAEVLAENNTEIELIPLIESQAGVRNAQQIAGATHTVTALFLGSVDLSGELGSDMGWDALYRARSQLVEATSEAGIDCIDGPWLDVENQNGYKQTSRGWRRWDSPAKHLTMRYRLRLFTPPLPQLENRSILPHGSLKLSDPATQGVRASTDVLSIKPTPKPQRALLSLHDAGVSSRTADNKLKRQHSGSTVLRLRDRTRFANRLEKQL